MLSQIVPLRKEPQSTHYFETGDHEPTPALDRFIVSTGRSVTRGRDEAIFFEGEASSKLYKVDEGAVRVCRFRRDGSRQIEAFYLPGDYFGFEVRGATRFRAEATTRSVLLSADTASVLSGGKAGHGVLSAMWNLAVEELHRSQNHALVLGYRHAQDRVLAFLEDMADRLNCASAVDLPMSRQDIADYLGLTIETVSRSFTDLARAGAISMPRPRTVILTKAMRARVAGGNAHQLTSMQRN